MKQYILNTPSVGMYFCLSYPSRKSPIFCVILYYHFGVSDFTIFFHITSSTARFLEKNSKHKMSLKLLSETLVLHRTDKIIIIMRKPEIWPILYHLNDKCRNNTFDPMKIRSYLCR